MHTVIHVAPLALLFLMAESGNPRPWDEVLNRDGLQLLARDAPGSKIREVKVETVIDAPAEVIWQVVNDQVHYVEFMPYVVEIKILPEGAGPDARYEYHLVDPPFVGRRDYTLKARFEVNPVEGKYRRSWSVANDKGPIPQEGIVRVSIAEGYWEISRLTDRSAHVTYWVLTDPGGAIPAWVANKANTTSVPELIRAVRNRSLNPQWRRK